MYRDCDVVDSCNDVIIDLWQRMMIATFSLLDAWGCID